MNKKTSAAHFPIEFLDNLIQIDHSCVEIKTQKCHLVMNPFHLINFKESLKNMLDLDIMKYNKKYDGILLNYKNMKLLPTDSLINRDNVYVHVNIQADFFIFKPQVGKVLMGIVNKKSKDHVGALIYNQFNVSLPKVGDTENWIGSKVKIGHEIALSVTYINYDARLPFIKAELISILSEQDSGISTEEEKEKKTHIRFDSSEDEEVQVKKKKVKQKKKTKVKDEPINIKTELISEDENQIIKTEVEDFNIEEPKKKKKHKEKKHKVEAVKIKQEILSDELESNTEQNNNPLKSWNSDNSLNLSSLFEAKQSDISYARNLDMADEEDKKSKRRSRVSLSSNSVVWDSKTLLPDLEVDEIFSSAGIKGNNDVSIKKKRKRSDSDNLERSKHKKHKNN